MATGILSLVATPYRVVYGSTPAEFRSRHPLAKSVNRLKDATRRVVLFSISEPIVVGKVTESRVCLHCVRSFSRNSFKPYFVGKFVSDGGRTVLHGEFRMHRFVQAFMTCWLGFCALWTAMATTAALHHLRGPDTPMLLPLFGMAMFVAGTGLVWACRHFSRGDETRMSSLIARELGEQD